MQTLHFGLTLIASVTLTLASCSNDDITGLPGVESRQICFDSGEGNQSRSVAESFGECESANTHSADTFSLAAERPDCADYPTLHCTGVTTPMAGDASRASTVTNPSSISEIGVVAYASWYAPLLMNNDKYTRNASGIFQSTDIRYWVDNPDATVDFYAFYPYRPDGLTLPSTKASTVLTYTVAPTASAQSDLLLAASRGVKGNFNQAVGLSFKHLLSGVRVKFTDKPAGWTVKSVNFEGVHLSGSLDFAAANPVWTYTDNGANSMSQSNPGDEVLFMTLPLTATASAPVTFTIVVNDGTADRTYTRQITAANWTMGNITTYSVSVTNFTLSEAPILDAHFVICNTTVKAEGVKAGRNWTVTVASDDGADLSLQLTADVNDFVKQGFWTDKKMINGTTITDESARGSNTITCTGPGEFPVTIFVPENISEEDRTITLTIKVDGNNSQQTVLNLTQVHPARSGNIGWEQINDNQSGVFGFLYTAKRVYVYNDGDWENTANQIIANVNTLIQQYNATTYAKCVRYRPSPWIAKYRNYVEIDYSKLNALGINASSTDDGEKNTRELFSFGGTALTNNFEKALQAMRRINDPNTEAYVPRRSTDPSDVPQEVTGALINESQMLTEVLKKNRYYLNTSTEGDLTTTTALIRAQDITWYIPAVDQFSGAPAWMNGAVMNAADYWSSTAGEGITAYTGAKTTAERTEQKNIRVARNL